MQDYKTIRSISEIDEYIGNATILAFDFETAATDAYREEEYSALDAHKSDITGISISVAAGTARYIPLRHRVGQNADVETVTLTPEPYQPETVQLTEYLLLFPQQHRN